MRTLYLSSFRVGLATVALGWMAASQIVLAQNPSRFDLRDGDRVVLIGDTLIEREVLYGHFEYLLTTQFPDRNITFRNLGWSADLPNGKSRVSFDWHKSPDDWFRQLRSQIRDTRPTVVLLGYGMAASFDGEPGLEGFIKDMERLMDAIAEDHPGVRFIVMSPIRHEKLPAPLPDPEAHNAQIELYSKALQALAERRGAVFVPLFERLTNDLFLMGGPALTDNGIHLTDYGHRRAAEVLGMSLNWYPNSWRLGITQDGKVRNGAYGNAASEIEKGEDRLRMVTQEEMLVLPPLPDGIGDPPMATPKVLFQVAGMKPGSYDYLVDGRFVQTMDGNQLSQRSIELDRGPHFDQAGNLLRAIREKNELFFHRWRPQNSTYLFLFRKHEQGQNAREIPMFDPLIEAKEKEIAALRRPAQHTIEILPSDPARASSASASQNTATATPAGPLTKDIEELPLPAFQTDPQVEIRLWARHPLLAKPIQMNFDPQGRLWVASSSVYPQIQPGQEADDKILVLEDVDGDGVAEKSTVFADGLLIPTGVEPGDGGVYVGQSTELFHLRDTNGDGRADERRIVLSGFGTEDTHHILHTLRWGYDGALYMNQSIYIHSHIETPHGVVRLNSGGILKLQPASRHVEVFMKGLVNSWGHHFDLHGQSFATDGAGTPEAGLSGISYVVPGAMYHTYAGARRILGSVSPGSYPKFASLEFLHSPHFPDDWQGQLVTCDFRANRVVRFALEEKDSAYVATEQPLFLRANDVTFRPIDVKVGPDGALYIADWTNPIIQHGEVDFRDPRRDHVRGRIWRVTMKGRSASRPPDLAAMNSSALLNLLLSSNGDTRHQARRLLTERGAAIREDLNAWTAGRTDPREKLEALWMFQGLGEIEERLLRELLNARDGRVRAAATRVLDAWQDRLPDRMDLLGARIRDEHPRVRLEAMRALSRVRTAQSAEWVLGVLNQPMDRHLDYTLWLTINDLAGPWIESVESGQWKVEGRESQLEFALNAIDPAAASRVMARLLGDQPLPRDGSGPWIDVIAKAGGPAELRRLFDQVAGGGFDPGAAARALAGLTHAARVRRLQPEGDKSSLGGLMKSPAPEVRVEAVRLAGVWKAPGDTLTALVSMAGDSAGDPGPSRAAFDALRDVGGRQVLDALLPLTGAPTPPAARQRAILVVASIDIGRGAPLAIQALSDIGDESAALNLWRDLLRIRGASGELLKALPKTGLSPVLAKTGLRAAREAGRDESGLILALSRGADLDEQTQELTAEEMARFAEAALREGDPARGEAIYRRTELACVTCHAIGGVGGKVGPDMTSIGASAPVDYLIESLLYPNRKIKEGYHSVILETRDGEEFSGILTRESSDELFVRDVLNREVAVAKNNVARRTAGHSLMPAGLIDGLSHQDRLDLVRFLAALGKPGPYDATQASVARLWRLIPVTIDLAQFGVDRIFEADIRGRDWTAAATTVDGRLLAAEMKGALDAKAWRNPEALFAAAQFDLPAAGKIRVLLERPEGAEAWVDGVALDGEGNVGRELPAGRHTLVVRIGARPLPGHIRARVDGAVFAVD